MTLHLTSCCLLHLNESSCNSRCIQEQTPKLGIVIILNNFSEDVYYLKLEEVIPRECFDQTHDVSEYLWSTEWLVQWLLLKTDHVQHQLYGGESLLPEWDEWLSLNWPKHWSAWLDCLQNHLEGVHFLKEDFHDVVALTDQRGRVGILEVLIFLVITRLLHDHVVLIIVVTFFLLWLWGVFLFLLFNVVLNYLVKYNKTGCLAWFCALINWGTS